MIFVASLNGGSCIYKNIKMIFFKSSRIIQKKDDGPDQGFFLQFWEGPFQVGKISAVKH